MGPAPASPTHTLGASAGSWEGWDSGPRPGGVRRRVRPEPEGESRTKGGAGLSPGGHRRNVRGAPSAPLTRAGRRVSGRGRLLG